MAPGNTNQKVASSLVTLSSAAILAVYAAGFMKTRAAADRMEEASSNRRPTMPGPATAGETSVPEPIEPPEAPPTASTVEPPGAAATATVEGPAEPKPMPASVAPEAPVSPTPATSIAPAEAPADPAPQSPPFPPPTETGVGVTAVETVTEQADTRAASAQWKDGTYSGWGMSRHGNIQATIVIEGGRIVSSAISRCQTRYSCSWIVKLPPQIVERQSPDCDFVSGATESADAFYYAIVDALSQAT